MAEPAAAKPAPAERPSALALSKLQNKDNIIQFKPQNFQELWQFVTTISNTDMVPVADRNKPGQIIAKIQYGSEVGLPPMTALRYIAVLPSGLATIWGAGARMLVTSHPLCEGLSETLPHDVERLGYAECTIKRKGWKEPVSVRYTKEMATTAKLWGGTGDTQDKRERSVWFKYPWAMLAWRAFHLCTQRSIPEALGGLVPREIAEDYDIEVTARPVTEDPNPPPQPVETGLADPAPMETEAAEFTDPQREEGSPPAQPAGPQSGAPAEKPRSGTATPPRADAPPSLEERLAWLANATMAEVNATAKDQPMLVLKGLAGPEQAVFCTALTDRRRELADIERATS